MRKNGISASLMLGSFLNWLQSGNSILRDEAAKCPERNNPLVLSAALFCHGLPGTIKAISYNSFTARRRNAQDTNSCLFLLRRRTGDAVTDKSGQNRNHPPRNDASQTLAGILIDHSQARVTCSPKPEPSLYGGGQSEYVQQQPENYWYHFWYRAIVHIR